ncbi:membrane hypothetical protein [Frankia canadensis]|uniref:Uncharacterized protein n=1 Tax=Frankia canadensis TaxID=1836972 RepID=A0A2I2L1R4_9ACTN|nr:hypothetical protein [Frankia canadensis]SNQ51845.1 membrane hypothetical protein [Frankia canadensis]SOU59135.1 membrane hypothetical protein [Frankia canadensis]
MTAAGDRPRPAVRLGRDRWSPPAPVGYLDSVQALGGLAAPLLAGASFTLAALLLPATAGGAGVTPGAAPGSRLCRWPDITLFCFIGSGLAQVATVQATVWCRRLTATPAEFMTWYPDEVHDGRPSRWLRNVQASHQRQALRWADRARLWYHAGILLLLAGLVAVSVPPWRIGAERGAVVALTVLGLLGELAWLVVATFRSRTRRRQGLIHGVGVLCGPVLAVAVAATPSGTWGTSGALRGLGAAGVLVVGVGVLAVAVEIVVLVSRLLTWGWFGVPVSGVGPGWARVATHVVAIVGIAAAVTLALAGTRPWLTAVSVAAVVPAFALEMICGWQVYGAERHSRGT